MFSALRQGSTLYILSKGDKPELRIGTVTAVSDPVAKFGSMPVYGQPQPTTVNVTVKVDESTMTFEKLDSGAVIMTYPNENTVVASSREAMAGEVEAMERTSRQIVESVPYHQSVLSSCDGILRTLNPQFAKEKEREEKMTELENKVSGIDSRLTEIKDMIAGLASVNAPRVAHAAPIASVSASQQVKE